MRRFGSVLVLCLVVTAFGAQAQDKFPSKPVKVVVPFGPGSATDIVMRIVGEHMRQVLAQPVVIENKPGDDAGERRRETGRTFPCAGSDQSWCFALR